MQIEVTKEELRIIYSSLYEVAETRHANLVKAAINDPDTLQCYAKAYMDVVEMRTRFYKELRKPVSRRKVNPLIEGE